MKNRLKQKKGFSLIEVLIGTSIFVLIVGVLTLFSRNIWVYQSYISTGLSLSNEGRAALKTMTAEIRTASTADTGVFVIALATSSAFTFYSDIDDDGLKEKVRYFLNGSSLQKGVLKPTGSPLAKRVIFNLYGFKIFARYKAVVSPSIFGLKAKIISL